jgi:hypothetical protein
MLVDLRRVGPVGLRCARMCHFMKPMSLFVGLIVLGACADSVSSSVPDASTDTALPRDTPPSPDVVPTLDGGGCVLLNGGRCALGATCPAGDGCNVCLCTAQGTMCTTRGCMPPDAGPSGCRSRADCPSSQDCHFAAPGCGVMGTCASPRDCARVESYCGCDGTTFQDCPGGATQPFRAPGECPAVRDGGTPDRCAGASIARDGRSCAGPADNPLPLSCCRWVCDLAVASCESLPPRCPSGEVNTVVGGCWGPCVPPSACMPFSCRDGNTCPASFRCNTADRRCVYAG